MSCYYLKQTVFPSRMASHYFHDFTVRVKKSGNDKRYSNDDNGRRFASGATKKRMMSSAAWQELTEPTESMQRFFEDNESDNEEEELVLERSRENIKGDELMDQDSASSEPDEYSYLDVWIFATSMSIDMKEQVQFPSTVLDASVLPGNEDSKEEDTLVVTLEGGLLLLIRIVMDDDGDCNPVVVQRVSLDKDGGTTTPLRLGYKVDCFRPGTLLAVSAFEKVMRLFRVNYDKFGVPYLTDSINLITGGALLKMCFLEPVSPEHVMIVSLVVTDDSLLHIEFNEFYLGSKTLDGSIKKSVFSMLSVKFELPYFAVPLRQTKGILLVQETHCCIRGLNYFMSHDDTDESDIEYPFDDFKPNGYYIPKSKITCLPCEEYDDPDIIVDQVLLSDAHPAMWLLEVFYNTKKAKWHMKLRRLFSLQFLATFFSMEEVGPSEYEITFSNERGSMEGKILRIVTKDNGKTGYKIVANSAHETNWFPCYDFAVTDASPSRHVCMTSTQNMWCLGRTGKKSSIFLVHRGVHAEKSARITEFKDASKVWQFTEEDIDQPPVLVVSFPYKSVVVCPPERNDETVTILDDFFVSKETLWLSRLPNGQFLQVFEDSWRVGDFKDIDSVVEYSSPVKIILASASGNKLALAYETVVDGRLKVDIEVLQVGSEGQLEPLVVEASPLASQPSMLTFTVLGDIPYLIVGDFDNKLHFYEPDGQTYRLKSSVSIKDRQFSVPHELAVIGADSILVSSKDGSFAILKAGGGEGELVLYACVHLGDKPVDIISKGGKQFYLVCKTLWNLDLNKSCYPVRVCVGEGVDRGCTSALLLPSRSVNTLYAIRDDGLATLYISDYTSANLKKIALGSCGLKMFHYSHQRMFVVIMDDPKDKLVFTDHNHPLQQVCDQEAPLFRKEEFPTAVFQWTVPSKRVSSYVHHHLVVSCINKQTEEGIIKIVEVKRHRDLVNLKLLNEWTENEPIYAVSQLSDSTLIYGSGKGLFLKRYLPEESKMSDSDKQEEFLSEVKSIEVDRLQVLVTTATNSFNIFNYTGERLEPVQGDSVERTLSARAILHHLDDLQPEGSSLVTVSDKLHSRILTLQLTQHGGLFSSCAVTAQAKVPYIPRVYPCDFKPVWRTSKDGILDSFVAVGLNGQIDMFTIIDKKRFDLLDSAVSAQFTGHVNDRFVDLRDLSPLELSQASATKVIDGGILEDKLSELGSLEVDRVLHSFHF